MDDASLDSQWSDAARERYLRRTEDLIAALRAHSAQVIERRGRERELQPYFSSIEALEKAAAEFNEAEFDWCGSTPLSLMDDDTDEFDDEDEDDEASGPVLSGLFRWDFTVTDEAAVIAAGRDAFRRAWPTNTDEDAALAVPDITRAAAEIVHVEDAAGLENTPGLERRADWWTFISHDGQSDDADTEDPFAIAR
jgi:hypothetical protein